MLVLNFNSEWGTRHKSFLLGVTSPRFKTFSATGNVEKSSLCCRNSANLKVCEMFLTEFIQLIVLTSIFSWHTLSLQLYHKYCFHKTTVNGALHSVGAQLVICGMFSLSRSPFLQISMFSNLSLYLGFCKSITLSEGAFKTMMSKIVLPTSSLFILLPCFILLHSAYQIPGHWDVWVFPSLNQSIM